jgi:hypothetical protein
LTTHHVEVPDRVRSVKRAVPGPVKQAARAVLRGYGCRTAGSRPMPDFLVIGAKRGGTTSLWNYLVRHPDVLPLFPALQQIKSPHYFDINHSRGQTWYRSHFATRRQRVRHERETGHPAVTGEASPYYMFHPLAVERIAREMPQGKFIVSLRNPVDRAYSNYNERRGCGVEPLSTFEEAIAAEPERLRGEVERMRADPDYYSPMYDSASYLARGRYLEHLQPWLETFRRDQVHIVLADQMKRDSENAFRQICEFLGIRPLGLQGYPRYNLLPTPAMDPKTRERLVEYFRPHNAALSAAVDMELDWDR